MVLALLGFFYTVVPLYQRELVNEEFARTKLEQIEVKEKLKASKAELNGQLEEIDSLKREKSDLVAKLEKIRLTTEKAVKDRELAISALSAVERKYRSTEKKLSTTERSLNRNHVLRILQTVEWFSSVGSMLEACSSFRTKNESPEGMQNTRPDCTAYGLIKSALRDVSRPNATDPSGDKLDAPPELIQKITSKTEELLELHKLQLNTTVSEKRKLEVIHWFFDILRKEVGSV